MLCFGIDRSIDRSMDRWQWKLSFTRCWIFQNSAFPNGHGGKNWRSDSHRDALGIGAMNGTLFFKLGTKRSTQIGYSCPQWMPCFVRVCVCVCVCGECVCVPSLPCRWRFTQAEKVRFNCPMTGVIGNNRTCWCDVCVGTLQVDAQWCMLACQGRAFDYHFHPRHSYRPVNLQATMEAWSITAELSIGETLNSTRDQEISPAFLCGCTIWLIQSPNIVSDEESSLICGYQWPCTCLNIPQIVRRFFNRSRQQSLVWIPFPVGTASLVNSNAFSVRER